MKIKKRRLWIFILPVMIAVMGLAALGGALWYRQALTPIDNNNHSVTRISVKQGDTSASIADELVQKKLIRNALAFSFYVRWHGLSGKFQSGVYSVKPSQTAAEIAQHLTSGKSDEVSVTFYPGSTLDIKARNSDGREVASVLKNLGFSNEDIKKAFSATYTSDVFAGRPAGSSLEGYIYGETFYVLPNESAEQILLRSIRQLEKVAKEYKLEEKFKARGLTLYQGITLASIVQKESIGCGSAAICEDQRQIASVFYNRLKANMALGSDVTYQYVADRDGIVRSPDIDSPYNTRRHKGLPPGPIATPSLSALNAVADPAATDYLYFLSGDNDVTYFSKTNEGHEANIRQHCQKKCQIS